MDDAPIELLKTIKMQYKAIKVIENHLNCTIGILQQVNSLVISLKQNPLYDYIKEQK